MATNDTAHPCALVYYVLTKYSQVNGLYPGNDSRQETSGMTDIYGMLFPLIMDSTPLIYLKLLIPPAYYHLHRQITYVCFHVQIMDCLHLRNPSPYCVSVQ